MRRRILSPTYSAFAGMVLGAVLLTLCLSPGAFAQAGGTVNAGTAITVRTNEYIDSENNDGRVYRGTVQQNVLDRNGDIAIPRGSEVELVVHDISSRQVALDLNSVIVNGEHFNVSASQPYVNAARRQIQTRGRAVYIPNNSVLTFRLEEPLRMGYGYSDTRRYKPGYNDDNNSAAYRAGMAAGRADAERNLPRSSRTSRWTNAQDRRDYEAGYDRGYDNRLGSVGAPVPAASLRIGGNNNIIWQSPVDARVFVQVDNNPVQLFAQGATGNQVANWIERGHVYVFMVRDMNGNELARERLDLRRDRR